MPPGSSLEGKAAPAAPKEFALPPQPTARGPISPGGGGGGGAAGAGAAGPLGAAAPLAWAQTRERWKCQITQRPLRWETRDVLRKRSMRSPESVRRVRSSSSTA